MRCSTANCALQQVLLAQRSAVPSIPSRKRNLAVLAAIGNGNGNGKPAADGEGEADAAFDPCMSSPACMVGSRPTLHVQASVSTYIGSCRAVWLICDCECNNMLDVRRLTAVADNQFCK
jgi:hypothetical protein